MDLTNITTPQTKTPHAQTESPPQTHLTKSLSFTNKTFQLQACHHRNQPPPLPQPQPMVVSYKECLKNHAATMGGHALDGCGEFMPSPTATPLDPTSLKCAACGCHRNFHRRDPYHHHQPIYQLPPPPPPPRSPSSGPSSAPSSPQQQASPVPYSYYTSAPHMLLALSTGYPQPFDDNNPMAVKSENRSVKKRSRTKFSQDQKDKMSSFADKLGWRLQRSDDRLVQQFCSEVGVERGIFKVWMHNNKQTFGKRGMGFCLDNKKKSNGVGNVNGSRVSFDNSDYKTNTNGGSANNEGGDHVNVDVTANGSYSSSLAK